MSGETLAGLLSRCLRAAGVTRAFRAPGHVLPSPAGIEIIDVPDAALAGLLADADGRLARSPSARPGLALLDGRYNVAFADLKAAALPALRHRVVLNFEAQAEGIESDEVLLKILDAVPEKEKEAA